MSVWETVLIYVVVPLGIYLLVALWAARKGLSRRPRYRPGEPWDHPPVWWSANPAGARLAEPVAAEEQTGSVRGGAHGDW